MSRARLTTLEGGETGRFPAQTSFHTSVFAAHRENFDFFFCTTFDARPCGRAPRKTVSCLFFVDSFIESRLKLYIWGYAIRCS